MDALSVSTLAAAVELSATQLGAGNLSYLMTWQGSQADLKPVIFVAHTDVVPVPDETLKVRLPSF